MKENLKTVHLDIEDGCLKVNNEELRDVDFMQLTFQDGLLELQVRQHKRYYADGKAVQESTARGY